MINLLPLQTLSKSSSRNHQSLTYGSPHHLTYGIIGNYLLVEMTKTGNFESWEKNREFSGKNWEFGEKTYVQLLK